MVIESLCMNCEKNGKTTILLTKIPFFREIIISSFYCDECGFRNNEVQFGGKLPDFGVQMLFRVMRREDLNRELIKSEHTVIHFQEIDLEIPANGKAEINTIEGYLLRTYEELVFHQKLRQIYEPETYEKLEVFLRKVKTYLDGEKFPLTIKVRDPSGNSCIKNPFAPRQDKNLEVTQFERSMEELVAMGYSVENAKAEQEAIETKKLCTKLNFSKPFEENNFLTQEPVIFAVPCHSCGIMGEVRMCQTSVPYFTDLIIMSFRCDYCGAHSTETKSNGEVKENASVLTLKVEGDGDLKRDLFKVPVPPRRARPAPSTSPTSSWNWASARWEACSRLWRDCWRRSTTTSRRATPSPTATRSSADASRPSCRTWTKCATESASSP
jgi:zinc finger protein